jgi:4-hydroxy 2-oxovalerate aldolase
MASIHLLDCTLRDGGYCNAWNFGFENIKTIIAQLVNANIDIIECGYLSNNACNPDISRFSDVSQLEAVIPANSGKSVFVAMMDYGEFDDKTLPAYNGGALSGIRVAFHKRDRHDALEACHRLQDKGYEVYVQAMVTPSYTPTEFCELIGAVNNIKPYAFYIVDSFGMMKIEQLTRLFYATDFILDDSIALGFHSHNNMQNSYSNAQYLAEIHTRRSLIIDATVMGMGRGAGNLNLELFAEHINDMAGEKYKIKPMLSIIDEVLSTFYKKNYWGYSLPNYLSAFYNLHPNYALYLDEKMNLAVENIEGILSMIEEDKRISYDKNYIEQLYCSYMSRGETQSTKLSQFRKAVSDMPVLLICPGKSATSEADKIAQFATGTVTISVNFDYPGFKTDYIFTSNLKRFKQLDKQQYGRAITTSNINSMQVFLTVDYASLTNNVEGVKDNAALMAVQFLIGLGVKKIILAGLDGFSHESEENYANGKLEFVMQKAKYDLINVGIEQVLRELSKRAEIAFATSERFVHLSGTERSI